MQTFYLKAADDFEGWRKASRSAFENSLPPEMVSFQIEGEQQSLLDALNETNTATMACQKDIATRNLIATKTFLALAKLVVCHSDSERFSLLYKLLLRLQNERNLLGKTVDPEVHHANALAKEVRRDMHKMKAFVRFRKTDELKDGTEQFVAWFEPTHHIVKATAPFFMRRFAGMHWSILSPNDCVHWDGKVLRFSEGVPKSKAPKEDALEDYWRSYYASIFNPARLKVGAMTSEMPKKYWKNLPEADLIPGLIQQAQSREQSMLESAPTVPIETMMQHRQHPVDYAQDNPTTFNSLEELNSGLNGCRLCPLYKPATQVVCGQGVASNDIMLIGEQPGDHEDIQGQPFVGPAGQLLKSVMADLEIEIPYITNAVKHFKFEPCGKRRIHKTPNASEIDHCRWWLQKEIELVKPKVIVAMGASALRGVTGKSGKISELKRKPITLENEIVLVVTRHPSSILRTKDVAQKAAAHQEFKEDLRFAHQLAIEI